VTDTAELVKHLEIVAETPEGRMLAERIRCQVLSTTETPVSAEVGYELVKQLEMRIVAGDRNALAVLEHLLGKTRDAIAEYGRELIAAGR
jgi:hypothetical protein